MFTYSNNIDTSSLSRQAVFYNELINEINNNLSDIDLFKRVLMLVQKHIPKGSICLIVECEPNCLNVMGEINKFEKKYLLQEINRLPIRIQNYKSLYFHIFPLFGLKGAFIKKGLTSLNISLEDMYILNTVRCILSMYLIGKSNNRKTISNTQEKETMIRDIHDGPIQSLFIVNAMLFKCRDCLKKGQLKTDLLQSNLLELQTSINCISKELRSIISHSSENDSLYNKLSKLTAEINKSFDVQVILSYKAKVDFDSYITKELFLIIKECIVNSIKHSGTDKIDLIIDEREELVIVISDNGYGFNKDTNSNGIGLLSVKKRIKKLNGIVDISTSIQKGTTINMFIPIYKGEKVCKRRI